MTQTELHQHHFEKVFSRTPVSADTARTDLRAVAESVWHKGFVPNLSQVKDRKALRRAAYMVDYLASNHMVSADKKRALKLQLDCVKERLQTVEGNEETFYEFDVKPRKNRDAFARRWHLASGMKPRDLGLLDMQRRANASSYA